MRPWLKGGIIGWCIYLITIVIITLYPSESLAIVLYLPAIPFFIVVDFLFGGIIAASGIDPDIIEFFIAYFLMGAVFGWLTFRKTNSKSSHRT